MGRPALNDYCCQGAMGNGKGNDDSYFEVYSSKTFHFFETVPILWMPILLLVPRSFVSLQAVHFPCLQPATSPSLVGLHVLTPNRTSPLRLRCFSVLSRCSRASAAVPPALPGVPVEVF